MRHFLKAATAAVFMVLIAPASALAGEVWLTMDQVRAYGLKDPVSSIVVGNPAIADVTVQSNEKILLYGKAPGLTNIFFFNKEGERVESLNIRVKSPTGNMLVLHRGVERATFSCTQLCEPTAVIGDSETAFGLATAQAAAKIDTASALAAASNAATAIAP